MEKIDEKRIFQRIKIKSKIESIWNSRDLLINTRILKMLLQLRMSNKTPWPIVCNKVCHDWLSFSLLLK